MTQKPKPDKRLAQMFYALAVCLQISEAEARSSVPMVRQAAERRVKTIKEVLK